MFRLETFISTPLFPSFISLLTLVHLLLFDFHVSIWECLGPKFFGSFTCPFSALTRFSPHFSLGDQPHFHIVHYIDNLFRELGTYEPTIIAKFLFDHCSFLLKAISVNNFDPPLPSPFEVGTRIPSTGCSGMHSSFHVVC
jgi:hypothetical protein